MKNIKRYLVLMIALFIFFPILTNAATELGASTQSPIAGTSFYVQLDVNYGTKLNIRDMHVIIKYDKSYLELEEIVWLQSKGTYKENNGTIYIDKEAGTDWRSGAAVQFKFKSLREGMTKIDVSQNGDSHYSTGCDKGSCDVIGQSFVGVSINAIKPSTSTLIGSLYVKGYTILPTFSKTTYNYNLTVPSHVTSVEVVATKSDSRQTITGAGTKNLTYGNNRVRVVVTAQDGSSRTYEIMINRTDNRTGDTSLKSLNISNTTINFQSNQKAYETTVGRSTDKVLINAQTTDPYATLSGTGEKELKIGANTFTLTVTSTSGKKEVYTIIINRSTEELNIITESSKLSSLRVNDLGLDLKEDKRKWLVGVASNYNELNINATPESKTAKVEIIGNENLKPGINIIVIKVTETKGEEEKTPSKDQAIEEEPKDITEYTLVVNKNANNTTVVNNFDDLPKSTDLIYNTTTEENNIVPQNVLNYLKNNNAKLYYNVVNIYNGLLYQAIISNNLPDSNYDISFSKTIDSSSTYKTNLKENTEITLYLGDIYQDDTAVKIYTYNEGESYKLLTDGIKVMNGYISFTTNGDTFYVFTTSSLIAEQSPFKAFISKYKQSFLMIMIIFIFAILIIKYISKKRKQKEQNEPLY